MSRIFFTGDTHGEIDINKLTTKKFPVQKELTREDLVIVLGDWGGIWDGGNSDRYVQKWWKQKNFTCCWVDGNHENFDLIEKYPVEEWNGGKIQRIADNIIHLMRGQVYTINGKTFYVMGGAQSVDRAYRQEGVSWWPQEIPNFAEEQEGFLNLQKHGDKVNYVLTHDGPTSVLQVIYALHYASFYPSSVSNSLDATAKAIQFDRWFFGHHHADISVNRYICCYQNVYEIKEDGEIVLQ